MPPFAHLVADSIARNRRSHETGRTQPSADLTTLRPISADVPTNLSLNCSTDGRLCNFGRNDVTCAGVLAPEAILPRGAVPSLMTEAPSGELQGRPDLMEDETDDTPDRL